MVGTRGISLCVGDHEGARFGASSRNASMVFWLGPVWRCNICRVKLRHTKRKQDIANYHNGQYRVDGYLSGSLGEIVILSIALESRIHWQGWGKLR
jgi:hypothetical protein